MVTSALAAPAGTVPVSDLCSRPVTPCRWLWVTGPMVAVPSVAPLEFSQVTVTVT
jgi:hypothetical protein